MGLVRRTGQATSLVARHPRADNGKPWIPGLAGTPTGLRLGTGGGWYDRALAHCGPQARIGLLLHDGEVRDELPTDSWDRRVDVILTATGSWECPRSGDHAGG